MTPAATHTTTAATLANASNAGASAAVPGASEAVTIEEGQAVIRMPLSDLTLVQQDGIHHGLLHLFVAIMPDGDLKQLREFKLPVRIPDGQLTSAPPFLAYKIDLPEYHDSLTVAVGARDPFNARHSFARLHLGAP